MTIKSAYLVETPPGDELLDDLASLMARVGFKALREGWKIHHHPDFDGKDRHAIAFGDDRNEVRSLNFSQIADEVARNNGPLVSRQELANVQSALEDFAVITP